jgi:hypothetical protein
VSIGAASLSLLFAGRVFSAGDLAGEIASGFTGVWERDGGPGSDADHAAYAAASRAGQAGTNSTLHILRGSAAVAPVGVKLAQYAPGLINEFQGAEHDVASVVNRRAHCAQ